MNPQELDEFGWIARHSRNLAVRDGVRLGIGDDAAVLSSLQTPVVTCDCLVENVHFRRDWTTPRDLGRKALSVNLSDIAAMGAFPVAAFVSLAIPPALNPDFWDEFYAGMEEIAARFRFTIAGGDTSRMSRELVINVTLIGEIRNRKIEPSQKNPVRNASTSLCQTPNEQAANEQAPNEQAPNEQAPNEQAPNEQAPNEQAAAFFVENLLKTNQAGASAARPITRSGAQSGDVLIVTGTLGDSVAGLWLLQNPHVEIAASVRERLLRRHFDPTPRLDEMQVALGVGGVRAALDLSDGLAGDAAHIAQRSRLTLEIETSKLPLSGGYLKTVQIKRNSELESEKSAMPIARIQRRNEEKTAPENRGFSAEENENRVLDGAAPVASEALFDARNWALSGGEDYELLLCVAPELAEETARQITTQTGTRATIIGRCIASADDENRVVLRDANGREFAAPRAWTHF